MSEFEVKVTITEREVSILSLTADGLVNKEIAQRLKISEKTVKFHKTNLYLKLSAKHAAHAVAIGFRNGIIH